jgi:nickel-dependent lactate racemase
MKIKIPYGKSFMEAELEDSRVSSVLLSGIHNYTPTLSQQELVWRALQNPIASKRLCCLAKDKSKILIITSDHTRPVPSSITLPMLLREIRTENQSVDIKILIATGLHRPMTQDEMADKFGSDLVKNEVFINHDGYNKENMVFKGNLPSGGELWLNALVEWADLIVSEGFIEPHFFAGFSGGRKSILPGIASEKTVLANHCATFIADHRAVTGNLADNPIHKDMLFAANAAGLAFILNVVLDSEKKIVEAFAGDREDAHRAGCAFVSELCTVQPVKSDIIISSNGGYPLDQNIYQAVKGMTAAEACAKEGSIIIMVAACTDGHGGEKFYNYLHKAASPTALLTEIEKVPQNRTMPDQWEAQILARILSKNTVIFVADKKIEQVINNMHMTYAETLKEALRIAEKLKGDDASVTVIPDGVSVILLLPA